jgi:hypothetical protein
VTIRPGQIWKGFSTESIFNLYSCDEIFALQFTCGEHVGHWRKLAHFPGEKALWQFRPANCYTPVERHPTVSQAEGNLPG